MSCKPHPSIPNWGTKQPSQCPALWVSQSPLQPRGQRGSRAFLLNQTGKHNPSLLFSATFIGKDPFSSCPSKFPRCTDSGVYHSKVILPKSTEAEQAPPWPWNVAGGFDRHGNQAEAVLEGSTVLSLRANT